jgi:group I intron endonuclease
MKSKGVYRIVNNINGKLYIGSTGSKGGFKKRWSYHLTDLRQNKHHSRHLQRDWNKYGEESFIFEILEIIEDFTKETLLIREQHYLDLYKSYDVNLGYNICKIAVSSLGVKKTEEEKLRQSELKKGKPIPWMNTGEPRSEEHRKNLSKSCKGCKSEKENKTYEEFYGEEKAMELKKKLSDVHKGLNAGEKHPMYGKHHTEETKKILANKINKIVLQKTLDGILIEEFESAKSAELKTGIPYYVIKYNCLEKNKKYGKYKWEYKIK